MSKDLGRAIAVRRDIRNADTVARVALDYDARMVRRKRLRTDDDGSVLVDLPETLSLNAGDALELEGGALVAVDAAPEPLLKITGDLPRLAWHIGNRHTPCAIANDHLLIREDHVLAKMLEGLGAHVASANGPFTPEGGAYGHGRTMGHSHGPHDHDHAHAHAHSHDH